MTKTASPILQLIRRVIDDPRSNRLPDGELLRRFSDQRDEAAFNSLLRRHGPLVLNVCRNVLNNESDAEDAFQATFLVLAQKAGSVQNKGSIGSWLYGVAYRTALKAKAQSATRRKHEVRVPVQTTTPTSDDLTWREVQQIIHGELNALSERLRGPLVLCYLEGRTQDEAAALLRVSKATLKKDLDRGKELLRMRLRRRGLGPVAVAAVAAWPATNALAAVPTLLLNSTREAATTVAAGGAAASVVSAKVAVLTEGVLKTMLLSKLKTAAVMILAVAFVTIGIGRLALSTLTAEQKEPQPATQDAKQPIQSRFFRGDHWVSSLAWSKDGQTLASIVWDATRDDGVLQVKGSAVQLWDLQTVDVKRTLAEQKGKLFQFRSVVFSPDGAIVAAVSETLEDKAREDGYSFHGEVLLWDARTGKLLHTLTHSPIQVRSAAFSPDGKMLASASVGSKNGSGGKVKLWDVHTGKLEKVLDENDDKPAWSLAFSPDGKTLAVGGEDEVALWDIRSGQVNEKLGGVNGALGYSPDGKLLMASDGNELQLYDVQSKKAKGRLDVGVAFSPQRFAFSPDNKTVAVGGEREGKHVVRLWDIQTGKAKLTLEGHEDRILCVAFSRDGKTLATGSEDKTIRIWDLEKPAK